MTTSSSAFKNLRMLEAFDLGRVRLRNRIIGAPMERNMATVNGHLTDAYIRYLTARAAGGVALVFTEASICARMRGATGSGS